MAQDALQVEAVDGPQTPVSAGEPRGQGNATAIYWWQIALLAARVGGLEEELARERRKRQRVIEHYEHLLAKRDAEIERLQVEREAERGSIGSFLSRR